MDLCGYTVLPTLKKPQNGRCWWFVLILETNGLAYHFGLSRNGHLEIPSSFITFPIKTATTWGFGRMSGLSGQTRISIWLVTQISYYDFTHIGDMSHQIFPQNFQLVSGDGRYVRPWQELLHASLFGPKVTLVGSNCDFWYVIVCQFPSVQYVWGRTNHEFSAEEFLDLLLSSSHLQLRQVLGALLFDLDSTLLGPHGTSKKGDSRKS